MATLTKAKLLCNFGGEFTHRLGRLTYIGGKTRLVLVDRSLGFDGLRSKMSQLSSAHPSCIEIKFQLPNETLDSRLVSVECDDDVVVMMSEFEATQRIPVYIFDMSIASVQRQNASPVLIQTDFDGPTSIHRENAASIDPQELELAVGENDLISLPRSHGSSLIRNYEPLKYLYIISAITGMCDSVLHAFGVDGFLTWPSVCRIIILLVLVFTIWFQLLHNHCNCQPVNNHITVWKSYCFAFYETVKRLSYLNPPLFGEWTSSPILYHDMANIIARIVGNPYYWGLLTLSSSSVAKISSLRCRISDDIPQASVDSQTSPALSELVNGRESHTLTVGQEFPDAQGFRDALTANAISSKFELTFIRSDRSRVTATCAADGCPWRIHASKLPDVETFQIKTLKGKHSCVRPERSSHRQANMKWILSCIMDRVRENINYKPKEIMRDIEQEYGVIIPYLKAHRAKERALELIFGMPIKNIVLNQAEVQSTESTSYNILDQQRRKPLKGSPVHCNLCKKVGHNRRTCIKLSKKESDAASLKEKNFHCMLCKQSGHNRRTCQCKVEQVWMN